METAPRFDPDTGTYKWEPAGSVALEPAFVREAIASIDPDAPNVEVRGPVGVVTFADVYPHGTKDHATTDAPTADDESFDPLAEWRVADDVADDILLSLPEGTPRMVRGFLTLLMGAMRRGRSGHSFNR